MNVFNKCILQDRKKEEFCLNLANMFHPIKGYYGPYYSKPTKTLNPNWQIKDNGNITE
jgi:hypothetical protein